MATFSIELPDRRVIDIEADDQATAVRGAKEWHAANPLPELSGTETVKDVLESGGRGIVKGAAAAVTAPYRLVDWLGEKATGGNFLPNVEDTSSVRAALNPPAPRSRAGRYAETVGEFAGSGGVASGAGLALARRLPNNWFLRSYATTPGAAVATDTAASVGGGLAVEAARENDFGTLGQLAAGLGGGLGGVGVLGTLSRGFNALPKIVASADGGLPGVTPQAQAQSYQMLADTLARAGKTPDEIRSALAKIDEARTYWSQGHAQDVTALADLDESLMRLAGSVGRQSPEAATTMRQFMEARQTGHTPEGVPATTIAERGLPTRSRFAEPVTGAEAQRMLGSRFDTPEKGYVPMGMVERVRDALRRAFLISDADYHGHGLTGLRTEQAIVKRAQEAARENYDQAYNAGQGVDLRDAIAPVFERYLAETAANEAPAVEALVRRVQSMFRSGPIELKQFDRTKRALDDVIKRFLNRPDKSGVHMGGVINDLKNDLLKAVDNATGGEASPYLAARNQFSSEMEMLNALRSGREAFRDGSEITADIFNSLRTEGEQKLFRLGLLDSITERGQNMARTHDFTKIFETPRVEGILGATIHRSKGSADTFANRPERFGSYLESQRRMVEAKNTVRGGSQTAKNLADDSAFDATQAISNLMELGRSPSSWLLNRVSDFAEKSFGLSADVSQTLAQMLFTADRQQRLMILREIAARMPPDRMTRFRNLMASLERAQARTATLPNITSATAPSSQSPSP